MLIEVWETCNNPAKYSSFSRFPLENLLISISVGSHKVSVRFVTARFQWSKLSVLPMLSSQVFDTIDTFCAIGTSHRQSEVKCVKIKNWVCICSCVICTRVTLNRWVSIFKSIDAHLHFCKKYYVLATHQRVYRNRFEANKRKDNLHDAILNFLYLLFSM